MTETETNPTLPRARQRTVLAGLGFVAATAGVAALGTLGRALILNGAWTPLFFWARRLVFAMADMIALDATALAYTTVASRVDKPAAGLVVPYLGWLGFATALNAKIIAKNPSFMLRT